MRSFSSVRVGEVCTIVDMLNDDKKINVRLCELGLVEGQKAQIVSKSLLKKVCLVEVLGYRFCVRTSLLKDVIVL